MIASRIGLAVLAAIALVLAALVALGSHGPDARGDGALLQDFDADRVLLVYWSGDMRARPMLERVETPNRFIPGPWSLCLDLDCPARPDKARVDEVFSALRGARWHRRAPEEVAGPRERTLAIMDRDHAYRFVELGRSVEGLDQNWLVVDGQALLVDGWVARALFPAPLELVSRSLFADVHAAESIAITAPVSVQLDGHPRTRGRLWVDPARVDALERALAAVELTALPRRRIHAQATVTLSPGLEGGGPSSDPQACASGSLPLWSTWASGCVNRVRWAAVEEAAAALARPDMEIADSQLVPIELERIELADHEHLQLHGRARVAGRDADPDRVAELVTALRTKGAIVAVPTDKVRATVTVTGKHDSDWCLLELHAGNIVVRSPDRIALKIDPATYAVLARGAEAYRDPTRWMEEPTTISTIAIDGVTHRRGAVLGEWSDTKEPALVEALATAAAVVRAPTGPAPAVVRHRVEFTVTPPAGPTVTHRLEVGDVTATGCAGRADGQAVQLPLALCTAVMAAAR